MLLTHILSLAASAAWNANTVFDPNGADEIMRNQAVQVDMSTAPTTKFYVAEGYDVSGNGERLFYKWFQMSLSSRYTISDDLAAGPEAFLPSVTTQDGDANLYVSAKWTNSGTPNVQEVVVDRDTPTTAPSPDDDPVLGNDVTTEEGDHSFIILDSANDRLHACFTRMTVATADDTRANYRDLAGAWQASEQTVSSAAGNQQHCSIAVRANGDRAIAYQDGVDIKVRYETTEGTADWTVNLTGGAGDDFAFPSIVMRDIGGTVTMHIVVMNTSTGSLKYRKCVSPTSTFCDDVTDWSSAITVEVNNSGDPTHAQLAVDESGIVYAAYADEILMSDDRIRVSHLCPGAGAFVDTDGGLIDGGADEEAFGVLDDSSIKNAGQAWPVIVANDGADKVIVAYLSDDDTGAGTDWNTRQSSTDYPTC
jgi:hypothetical protein